MMKKYAANLITSIRVILSPMHSVEWEYLINISGWALLKRQNVLMV